MELNFPYKKVLVLAPHTDDAEFGCGGTLSRLVSEGCEIKYVVFSDCKESVPKGFPSDILRHEMHDACNVLGITDIQLLDYKVRYFDVERQRILEDLIKIKREFKPQMVLAPCSMDIHQDHSTISTEAIRAFKDCTLLGYELPWNNLTLPSTCIVKISEENLEQKIKAIAQYRSQIGRAYSSPAFLRGQAITRGTRIRTAYAEAFEMIRFII